MKVHQATLEVRTSGRSLTDLTARVRVVVEQAGVVTGLVTLFIQHTSASLVIQENADPSVLRDLQAWIDRAAPESSVYEHDDEGPDDMPGHIRSVLTRTSESIPIGEGAMRLGTWQAIYLWEHRTAPRTRQVVVHVQGV